jgi:cysteine desulfurase
MTEAGVRFITDVIYLDHNATTPVAPEVADLMDRVLREDFGNPSSGHPYGHNARRRVDEARTEVGRLLGCSPKEILFTGGGSESNNLAIRGMAEALGSHFGGLVISAVEHPAVMEPARWLEQHGVALKVVSVDGSCGVRPADVERAVRELRSGGKVVLVSIMHANNEVGTIQPISEIAQRVRPLGAMVHTDAAQTVGKIPVNVTTLDVDLLAVAGHKFYGPKGVGALYFRPGTPLTSFILGAGHEMGLRAGTENISGIAGLGEACRLAREHMSVEEERIRGLRDRFWQALQERIPGVERNGHTEYMLPNTLNISFPGVLGRDVLSRCQRIAATTGSACHEGEDRPSVVLSAMGLSPGRALGAVRLSLGRWTTERQVDEAVTRLAEAWESAEKDRDGGSH